MLSFLLRDDNIFLAYFCDIFISGKKRTITWTDFSTFSEWITIFDFMSHVNFLAISIHYIYKTVLYDMQLLCKRLCNSKWCTQSRSFLRSPMKLSQSWDHPPIHLSGCAIHSPYLSALDFWNIEFEITSLMNLIFSLVWTRFLQATRAVKIKFEIDKNQVHQTRFFKLDISKVKYKSIGGLHWIVWSLADSM